MLRGYKNDIKMFGNKHFVCLGFFSLVFAYIFNLSSRLHGKIGSISAFRGIDLIKISFTFLIALLILLVLLSMMKKLDVGKFKTITMSDKKLFFLVFGFLFMLYFICCLTFYPGVASYDTLYLLMYDTDMSKQHPMAYCALIRLLKMMGNQFGGLNAVVFIYTILQIFGMSLASAVSITWLKKRGCPRFFVVLTVLYIGCLPIFPMYAITMIKDSMFAAICILWIPLLVEIVDSKGEWVRNRWGMISTIFLCLSVTLLRSNGIYIVAPILIYLAVRYKKWRMRYVSILILGIVIGNLPNLYMASKGNQPLFQEKAGILIQQVSAVVANDGKFKEEQKVFLEQIMPLEEIKDHYNPSNVDPIKWNSNFNREFLNDHSKEFVVLWLELLPKNFKIYVRAYLYQTHGFWQTKQEYAIFYSTLDSSSGDVVLQNFVAENDLYNKQLFPEKLQRTLKNYYLNYSKFFSDGICFWILMTIGILMLCYKKKYFIVVVPCLLNWITIMISTPIAMQFRYILMVPFSLLILIGVFLISEENRQLGQ